MMLPCLIVYKPKAKIMYDGEYVGLNKILETGMVTVPKPMKVSSDS